VSNESIGVFIFAIIMGDVKGLGVNRFKVVAGAENKQACRFYEKNGEMLVKQIEVHRGELSNVYVFDTA